MKFGVAVVFSWTIGRKGASSLENDCLRFCCERLFFDRFRRRWRRCHCPRSFLFQMRGQGLYSRQFFKQEPEGNFYLEFVIDGLAKLKQEERVCAEFDERRMYIQLARASAE